MPNPWAPVSGIDRPAWCNPARRGMSTSRHRRPPPPPGVQELEAPEHQFTCPPTEEGTEVLLRLQQAVFGEDNLETGFTERVYLASLAQVATPSSSQQQQQRRRRSRRHPAAHLHCAAAPQVPRKLDTVTSGHHAPSWMHVGTWPDGAWDCMLALGSPTPLAAARLLTRTTLLAARLAAPARAWCPSQPAHQLSPLLFLAPRSTCRRRPHRRWGW